MSNERRLVAKIDPTKGKCHNVLITLVYNQELIKHFLWVESSFFLSVAAKKKSYLRGGGIDNRRSVRVVTSPWWEHTDRQIDSIHQQTNQSLFVLCIASDKDTINERVWRGSSIHTAHCMRVWCLYHIVFTTIPQPLCSRTFTVDRTNK